MAAPTLRVHPPAAPLEVKNTNKEVWIDDGKIFGEEVIFYVIEEAQETYEVVFTNPDVFGLTKAVLKKGENPFLRVKPGLQTEYQVHPAPGPIPVQAKTVQQDRNLQQAPRGIWIPPKNA